MKKQRIINKMKLYTSRLLSIKNIRVLFILLFIFGHMGSANANAYTSVDVSTNLRYVFDLLGSGTSAYIAYKKCSITPYSCGAYVRMGASDFANMSGGAVWYDKWTPGDTGTKIHIITGTASGSNDDFLYQALDTRDDSVTGNVITIVNNITMNQSTNFNLSKDTNGILYAKFDNISNTGSYRCNVKTGSCLESGADGWTSGSYVNKIKDLTYLSPPAACPGGSCCKVNPNNIISLTGSEVAIINNITTAVSKVRTPSLVFESTSHGFLFTTNSANNIVYLETLDGGKTWATATVLVATGDNEGVVVWYDKWTPGISTNKIHLIYGTTSTTPDQLKYIEFNPQTKLATTPISIKSATGDAYSSGSATAFSKYSISKASDGTLYAATLGTAATTGAMVKCPSTSDCTVAGWTTVANYPFSSGTTTSDDVKLAPLANNKMLSLFLDQSASKVIYSIFSPGTSSWTANAELSHAVTSSSYAVQVNTTVNTRTKEVYVCYLDGNTNVIKTAVFSDLGLKAGSNLSADSGFTLNPAVSTSWNRQWQCNLSYDEGSNSTYLVRAVDVGYSSSTRKLVVSKSIDGMNTWSNGLTLNTTNRKYDRFGTNYNSYGKAYVWYYDETGDDIYGRNIEIDISRDTTFTNQSASDWLHFF